MNTSKKTFKLITFSAGLVNLEQADIFFKIHAYTKVFTVEVTWTNLTLLSMENVFS